MSFFILITILNLQLFLEIKKRNADDADLKDSEGQNFFSNTLNSNSYL